jgi:hypothetical protein
MSSCLRTNQEAQILASRHTVLPGRIEMECVLSPLCIWIVSTPHPSELSLQCLGDSEKFPYARGRSGDDICQLYKIRIQSSKR